MISQNDDINIMIKTYNNTKVRTGQKITNTRMHTKGLIEYVYDKLKKEVDKVKRPQNKKINPNEYGQTYERVSFKFFTVR